MQAASILNKLDDVEAPVHRDRGATAINRIAVILRLMQEVGLTVSPFQCPNLARTVLVDDGRTKDMSAAWSERTRNLLKYPGGLINVFKYILGNNSSFCWQQGQ